MSAAPGEPPPGAGFGSAELASVGFDWDGAMHAGLGLLRLAPRDFWAMTPRELAGALGAFMPRHAVAPGRADLSAMMRRFPDRATASTPPPD